MGTLIICVHYPICSNFQAAKIRSDILHLVITNIEMSLCFKHGYMEFAMAGNYSTIGIQLMTAIVNPAGQLLLTHRVNNT